MILQDFINKYNGKYAGNTPENYKQCVGLVMEWLKDQGLPHVWGHAFSLLTNADPDSYEVIKNTPDVVPDPGDVIVWRQGFNGTFGHTAIVVKGNVKTFEVFEQNNPLGSPCRLHTYPDYSYVDGWLRNRAIITQPIAQLPNYFKTLLQENKLDINNEGQIREFFQKAIDYPSLKQDRDSQYAQNQDLARQLTETRQVVKTSDEAYNNLLVAYQALQKGSNSVSYSWSGLVDYLGHLLKTG